MTLGNRLKDLRARSQKTQEEISKLLRTYNIKANRITISRWENDEQEPSLSPVMALAKIYNVSSDYIIDGIEHPQTDKIIPIRIPVLGRIPAGVPIEAIEDILDWEELDPRQFNPAHEYFALLVIGDSMSPKYMDGDIVIVQEAKDTDSGKDVIAFVNGYDATLKKLIKYENGSITLQPLNPAYDPMTFTSDEINSKPVGIKGIIREIRRKVN